MAEGGGAVLVLSGAGFRYHDAETPALAGIDLAIGRGEMIAVLGPQGSGTSTLCRLAAGLLAERGIASGELRRAPSPGAAVAMLGDDPEAQITGMTSFVDDELRLPTRLAGDRRAVDVAGALAALGAARLRGRRLDALSGGERQLVALAGLTTLDPGLLVLDQPGLSLDPGSRVRLGGALARFRARGGAVLLAGHQHDELSAAADRVLFLEEGRPVREVAPPALAPAAGDALLAAHGVWSTLEVPVPASAPVPAPERSADRDAVPAVGRDAAPVVDPDAVPVADPDAVPAGEPPGRDRSDGEPEMRPEGDRRASAPPDPVALLELRGLSIARGGATIVPPLALRLGAGEILAVIGANGAGKSTLLRGIAGLLGRDAAVAGEVLVGAGDAAIPLQGLPAYRRAGRVAWVGQDPSAQLSAATVRGELERAAPLPRHRRADRARLRAERAAEVDALLDRTGLAALADAHPSDLQPAQRKELVIASALLLAPRVLLLDEPTLGRDLPAMRRLERILRAFVEAGGAVILTTHDLRWADAIADRTLRLGA
ncbi:ATP-binding cassette domain-containing protein [Leucobacter allii]|uniref:ATP-binding cassette domain-containing protein n=1 Tax=Leucobacter allii TaxID=2932247 RepID=A0ABY4FMW2_9MICO|nr:ATP-binding cassette domain-containing protein [Leucobacter allii]UOQ57628.1 ATP-binding cassette domain-containing protein [Leucobacter allii]